jgi:hypothetical protein
LGGVDSRRPRVSLACSCQPGRRGDDAEAESLIKENSLLIANLAQFAAFFGGMIICGVRCTTPIRRELKEQSRILTESLTGGDFVEAVLAN